MFRRARSVFRIIGKYPQFPRGENNINKFQIISVVKGAIHIDMSGRFHNREKIGIAYVSDMNGEKHKGTAIGGKVIKALVKRYRTDRDFARLYAICIYFIIRDDIDGFKEIIICNDEDFDSVKRYLYILFGSKRLSKINIQPIDYYRKVMGKNVKSLADGKAESYRKRGLKIKRWFRGTKLNVVEINFKDICDCWEMNG